MTQKLRLELEKAKVESQARVDVELMRRMSCAEPMRGEHNRSALSDRVSVSENRGPEIVGRVAFGPAPSGFASENQRRNETAAVRWQVEANLRGEIERLRHRCSRLEAALAELIAAADNTYLNPHSERPCSVASIMGISVARARAAREDSLKYG